MAFTPEDGTGLIDANAYITLAYANAYHMERGNSNWTGPDAARQEAIVRATDYIETRWGQSFRGEPEFLDTPQALSFPRVCIYDRNGVAIEGVPEVLKRATAEYALRALTSALMPDPTRPDSGTSGPVTSIREKVGPIESETRYAFGLTTPELVSVPAADRLVQQLTARRSGTVFR